MGWIVPTTADPLVIAGSYLALFGIVVPLLGPIALVLAIAAVRRRSRYPSAANMTRIVITMVLALLGTASTVFSVVGILAALRASGAI